MAVTPNGFIATPEGGAGWVSKAYVESLREMAKRCGNVILGRGAYDTMLEAKAFPLPNITNIVMTSRVPDSDKFSNTVFADKPPEDVLEDLRSEGFEEALLAGGGEVAGSFMADGLIDEIYLTVQPIVFGEGVRLFGWGEFERKLELLEVATVSPNEVRLHYAVKKHTLDTYLSEGVE